MAFFPDMADRCQFRLSGDPIRAIGWFKRNIAFPAAPLVSALHDIVTSNLKNSLHCDFYCGHHVCEFCYQKLHPGKTINIGDEAFINDCPAGNGAIVVPGDQYLFVAPALIVHYIEEHQYRPPQDFIDAIISGPSHDHEPEVFESKLRALLSGRDDGLAFVDEIVSKRKERDEVKSSFAKLTAVIESGREADALADRADLYLKMGDIDACLDDLSEAISMSPRPGWLFLRARLYGYRARWQLEIDDLTKVIEQATEYLDKTVASESLVDMKASGMTIDEWLPGVTRETVGHLLKTRAFAYRMLEKSELAKEDEARAKEIFGQTS